MNRLRHWLHRLQGTGVNWPPAHKERTLRSVLMDMPIPERLHFRLAATGPGSMRALVKTGDTVLKGQLLAEPVDRFGSPIHASTSGIVTGIEPQIGNGIVRPLSTTLTVAADREDRWAPLHPVPAWRSLASAEILSRLKTAGVTDPDADWLLQNTDRAQPPQCDILIINTVEPEPYVTANHALVRAEAQEVLGGALILQAASGASRCLLAIEAHQTDAVAALQAALPGTGVELVLLPQAAPPGDKARLIETLTGRQGSRTDASSGVALFDAGTARAAHDAILLGQPQISRVITVCGDTLRTPKNFRALLGTPVGFLLELCGVDYHRLDRLVVGGTFTGTTVQSLDQPVDKTSNCLIAATVSELPPAPPPTPCIYCDHCVPACPVGLMPQFLQQAIQGDQLTLADRLNLSDCTECGACAFVCPSHLPLVGILQSGKRLLQQEERLRQLSERRRDRFESRKARLARDAALRRGSRRRSVARPENPDVDNRELKSFSREQARAEIADAVARVRQRRKQAVEPVKKQKPDSGGDTQ